MSTTSKTGNGRRTNRSIRRGLDFIYRAANTTDGFDRYGTLLVCCFALVAATSLEADLRQLTRSRARKLGQRWARARANAPADPNPDQILDFVLARYALNRLRMKDVAFDSQVLAAAKRFSAQELLGFDPLTEPPAADLSYVCDCGVNNPRGRKSCKQCRRRLMIQSRYRVWMAALTSTYLSSRCGLLIGARYLDVLKWLPAMRPYPINDGEDVEPLREAIYAVTHIVYTLNDYGTYRISPHWLPHEFAFLMANVDSACERNDPEVLGELLDSLKAFGLRADDPLILRGTEYLLEQQNDDGSWGDSDEENIRTRCHTTWTAIDGLRSYAWRAERLKDPELVSLLKQCR